ncbi:helix-turn-helix domain-containing protein [Paenibacillus sp. DMB20]|uniref:helix-turn-helix domain-containing protein n=1 Tax=Paenibacillus sp. DMB20 TaxID=1642570 RepID=UPI00069A82D1|nr:helix-turn-helix transcriptional regulator [Paenibacillus sp. DMB20]
MEIFSLRLKWLRERENLSQKEVAEYIGMSPQGYGKIENGQREPNLETLALLAKKLNDSADFLLGIIHYDRRSRRIIKALDDYEKNIKDARSLITRLMSEQPTDVILATILSNEKMITENKKRFEIAKSNMMSIYMEIPMVPEHVCLELNNRKPE